MIDHKMTDRERLDAERERARSQLYAEVLNERNELQLALESKHAELRRAREQIDTMSKELAAAQANARAAHARADAAAECDCDDCDNREPGEDAAAAINVDALANLCAAGIEVVFRSRSSAREPE